MSDPGTFFALVMNAIPNPVFVKDQDHRFVFFNDAFCAALGRTRAELLGKNDFDLVPAEEARVYWEKDDAVFRTGQTDENEEALTDANGVRHWIVTRKSIVRLPDGSRYLVGVISDITQRKRADARLTDSIETMSEGFVLFDAADRLVLCNSKYKELYDIDADHLKPGTRFEDILRAGLARGNHREAAGDADAWVAERMAVHRAANGSFEQATVDGRWLRVVERRTGDGGTVCVHMDVTAAKQREIELRHAKDIAEAANRTKTEFLANMSHELRTPLNAVIGFSEVMAAETFGPLGSPHYAEYVADIRHSGQHLLHLISDILDVSKLDVGRLKLREEVVDLGALLAACDNLLRERAAAGDVNLEVARGDDLPALCADPVRLKQVLLNLLSNAIKFTPAGGQVTLAVTHGADGMTFTVLDTGIGMRPEDIPIALEPFQQIDSSLARRHDGAGLGLPLAKRLVELHGGTLEITSRPGDGTRAVVRLPVARMVLG